MKFKQNMTGENPPFVVEFVQENNDLELQPVFILVIIIIIIINFDKGAGRPRPRPLSPSLIIYD